MARLSQQFFLDRRGNVAITFALALLPLIAAVGSAIDYSHANSVKASMQSAMDSAALKLSQDAAGLSNNALSGKANDYFKAVFTRSDVSNVTITASYATTGGAEVSVNGSASVPTLMMGILGFHTITVAASSTAKWGSERLRVALALDVTGSMASAGKITALKAATKSLLGQLKDAAAVNGDVYVSIVPFNKDVNLGASNYSQNWIDWTEWEFYNGTCSKNDRDVANKDQCLDQGGRPVWTPHSHSKWNGCVTDRGGVNAPSSANYDQQVSAPSASIAASRYPAENYSACPVKVMGLTYDWSALNSLVDSMSPVGNTNQPIGLVWAWQALVGGGPLTAPAKDSNYTYKDVIILMSDGLNTENRWSRTQSAVDKRMYDGGLGTCANAKTAGVTIYTVHVNTDGDPLSTLLRNCASGTDKFWMITSASDLGAVFSTIATSITKLRVAR